MRIVIDLQGAQASNRLCGIGRYSLSLALAMARQSGDHEIFVALNGKFPKTIEPIRAAFDGLLPQDNIRIWQAPGPTTFLEPGNRGRRATAELVREAFLAGMEPDLVHVSSLFEGLADDVVVSVGRFTNAFPTAVTLYDLIPLIHRERYLSNPMNAWYHDKLDHLRRASLLLAISESSRQEAITHLATRPQNIVTILGAADSRFKPTLLDTVAQAELMRRHGISRSFVMYTGGDDQRKNMDGLIRSYARLPASVRQVHQLTIVCSMEPRRRQALMALAAEHGLSPGELILATNVSDDDLILLYNTCALFVFPSLHEGFGLPALEAMSCGAPVIGSNTTSVPEVIGRDDALFDPRSDVATTAKMLEVLADPELRADLARHGLQRAKAFSWDESARRAISAFERVHASRQGMSRPTISTSRRPRLAYVSPLPPDRSGIADYSAELLPELSRHYDIELITSGARAKGPRLQLDYPVRRPGWLRSHIDRFDRVLYHFGNSSFHDYMFDLLEDIPGTVVLHDFFLSDILADRGHRMRGSLPWFGVLYQSHGYSAIREAVQEKKNIGNVVFKYPANLGVLAQARGVIVHSNFSRHLADRWYHGNIARGWVVVPHLRRPIRDSNRRVARVALGLEEDAFLVCCFGIMGPTKLNLRALSGWLSSRLVNDTTCRLVFVGENHSGDYATSILQAIERSGVSDRIHITGWADPNIYRQYLEAADVALQLRAHSRGETSGTILDCMNHGLPTIVNACGAVAELPSDAVLMLPEAFDDAALAGALEVLWCDPGRRVALGTRAREVIHTRHDPGACADAYADAIERFYEHARVDVPSLLDAITALDVVPDDSECDRLAVSIASNHPALRSARRLFIDVSALVLEDLGTGVQRVTRSMLLELLVAPPEGFRVEPVYATAGSAGYRYARRFTLRFSECPTDWAADDYVDPQVSDVFLGLDLNQHVTTSQAQTLDTFRSIGVRIYHVVYDLLPVQRTDWFPSGSYDIHARWLDTIARYDGVVTISRTVADELQAWLAVRGPKRARPFRIGWCHLGADIDVAASTCGMPANAVDVLRQLQSAPSFLLVSTIEPRKGHAQTLTAFELLWAAGVDVRLVLVGKRGWMVEDLVQRLERHPERGQRLFWLEGASDEYLRKIYAASTCLIAASEGEGFCLPLIEAARHKLPILARDILVFREVAGDHAAYFSAQDAEGLAAAVRDWLELYQVGRHPRSDAMPWSTWRQSTQNLLNLILHNEWPIVQRPNSEHQTDRQSKCDDRQAATVQSVPEHVR